MKGNHCLSLYCSTVNEVLFLSGCSISDHGAFLPRPIPHLNKVRPPPKVFILSLVVPRVDA